MDCLKTLLQHHADYTRTDQNQNSVLHIAAIHGCNNMIDYMAKNLKIDIFARNKEGETALTICQKMKNTKGYDLLSKYANEYDNSKNIADSILEDLEKEEEHDKDAAIKRKAKRWRQKINKLAKQLNITPEEVEERLKKEEEEKQRQDELQLKKQLEK